MGTTKRSWKKQAAFYAALGALLLGCGGYFGLEAYLERKLAAKVGNVVSYVPGGQVQDISFSLWKREVTLKAVQLPGIQIDQVKLFGLSLKNGIPSKLRVQTQGVVFLGRIPKGESYGLSSIRPLPFPASFGLSYHYEKDKGLLKDAGLDIKIGEVVASLSLQMSGLKDFFVKLSYFAKKIDFRDFKFSNLDRLKNKYVLESISLLSAITKIKPEEIRLRLKPTLEDLSKVINSQQAEGSLKKSPETLTASYVKLAARLKQVIKVSRSWSKETQRSVENVIKFLETPSSTLEFRITPHDFSSLAMSLGMLDEIKEGKNISEFINLSGVKVKQY